MCRLVTSDRLDFRFHRRRVEATVRECRHQRPRLPTLISNWTLLAAVTVVHPLTHNIHRLTSDWKNPGKEIESETDCG